MEEDGVLTFDGNVRVKKKVRRKEHFAYGEKISYGTILQLCVACNKEKTLSKKVSGNG